MITVRTSPAYVNRVRQDWTANGGVYGDGGVYAVVPSNDPFAQLGPTLDLTFAGVPTDQFTAATTDGYSINLNLSSEIYQIAAQYAVWGTGGLQQVNFADIVTFTRASTATYFNSAGTLTTAAINEARFDYDPSTLAAQGLLIEEARTNSIRNNTMQGAAAGTPGTLPTNWGVSGRGTLTQTVVGAGTQNGINYVDVRFNGTTSTTQLTLSFEQTGIIAAANGQTWALSSWVSFVAGSLTNITSSGIGNNLFDAGSVYIGEGPGFTFTLTSTFTRYTGAGTISNASTASMRPYFYMGFASGVAIDITLRIGLPQLELGAFATSVIPTTTTALTRSADVASVDTLAPWLNQTEGTLFAEFTARLGVTQTPATFSGAGGTGYRVRKSSTNQYYAALRDGGSVKDIAITPSPALTEGQVIKVAVGVKLNDCALSGGGQAAVTQPAFSPMPTITDVNLGFTGTDGFALNGWFRRFTYYPRRLSNADLQTITA